MREYTLHEARSRQAFGRLTWLMRAVKNWKARRAMRVLTTFDDHMLKDIGLSRGELDRLMSLPLTVEVQWDTERLQRRATR